jgi:hypothetical protein
LSSRNQRAFPQQRVLHSTRTFERLSADQLAGF